MMLEGKRILIVGVASKLSIASGIAEAMSRAGAELAFTYQNEKLEQRVKDFSTLWNSSPEMCFPCDVGDDLQIEQVFANLANNWNGLDGIVHCVGFAPREQLQGNFVDVVNREGFSIANDISTYSLIALAKAGKKIMQGRSGAILTMSYLGAISTMPNYNIMGVAKASLESSVRWLAYSLGSEGTRVNAISAGPIKTLAASGISGFKKLLAHNAKRSPLRRNVTKEEIGNVATFLCSDLASGMTGEILYVDAGFHNVTISETELEI